MDLPTTRTRRPPDRKRQLAAVASELFRTRGYHGVGINEIAAAAGVSGPALYRHFTDKQAILAHVLLSGVDDLDATTSLALSTSAATAPERLAALLTALANKSVERREVAALWRWEGRHLAAADRREIGRRSTAVLARWVRALCLARTDLPKPDAQLLCWAALSVFGSLSVHHTTLARRRFGELVAQIAARVLSVALPEPIPPAPQSPPAGALGPPAGALGALGPPAGALGGLGPPAGALGSPAGGLGGLGPPSRREQLLAAATTLFHQRGFHAVSMEDVGSAVGIAGPSVYRHFPSKASLLTAICLRAVERLTFAAEHALRISVPPDEREALRRLVESYVRTLTSSPELAVSLASAHVHTDKRDRTELIRIQREYVAQWVHLLEAVHPGLNPREAKITVHAALAVANDLTRTRRLNSRPHLAAELVTLMTALLDIG